MENTSKHNEAILFFTFQIHFISIKKKQKAHGALENFHKMLNP